MATRKTGTAAKRAEEIKAEVKQAVVEKAEDVMDVAGLAAEKVKETAEKTKAAATKKADSVRKSATAAKKAVKEKVEEAKAETKKKVTRKPAKKIVLQYAGREIDEAELTERALAQFAALEGGAAVKKITLYLKPEESAAYYVINDQYTGRVDY